MTVHSLRWHSVYVAPIRVALGLAWFVGAHWAGARTASAALAFVTGVFILVFAAFNDPRSRFLRRSVEPRPLPPDAKVASALEQAVWAMYPSTIGLTVLAAIAIVSQPVLAALLGGISAGLGVAMSYRAYFVDPDLFFDRSTGITYRR